MRVLAGVDAVHLVVGAHHAADAGFLHGHLERQQVDLTQRPLVRHHVDIVAIRLLGIRDEVLDGGHDALRLDPAYLGRHDSARQDRILAQVLEVASVPGVAFHAHSARKQHVEPPIARLPAHDPAAFEGQLGIEARGQCLGGREGCRAAVRSADDVPHAQRAVIQLQRRDAEPRQGRDEAGSASRSGRRRPSRVGKPERPVEQVDLLVERHGAHDRVGARVRAQAPVPPGLRRMCSHHRRADCGQREAGASPGWPPDGPAFRHRVRKAGPVHRAPRHRRAAFARTSGSCPA